MKDRLPDEFAHFRLVHDAEGKVIALPSRAADERNVLAIDRRRWGLVRLHIFEGAGEQTDRAEAFEAEMQRASRVRDDTVARILSWGREGGELFYADEMLDAEPLPDYLARAGPVPLAEAARWMVRWIDAREAVAEAPASFLAPSIEHFQIILDRRGRVRPVFSEFRAWMAPGASRPEREPEWYLAQLFGSLLAGASAGAFHRESLSRNFEDIDEKSRHAFLAALEKSDAGTPEAVGDSLLALAEGEDAERAAPPAMGVREWLRTDLETSYVGTPEFSLPEEIEPGAPRYAVDATVRGATTRIQVLPGPDSIPREGWLDQHHRATRRPGRAPFPQLHVNYVEDRGSVTLLGEETVDGIDLDSHVAEAGPMVPAAAASVATRVTSALDLLERGAAACAVWWLPPENVWVVTGGRCTREAEQRFVDRQGGDAWEHVPLKLRLHQTTATLRRGVDLPPKVRELARHPGRGYRPARRSAVALPLLWHLLTGERFHWGRPTEEKGEVNTKLASLFDRWRRNLEESPVSAETDFFAAFSDEVASVSDSEERGVTSDAASERDNGFEAALAGALYEGEISLGGAEGTSDPNPALNHNHNHIPDPASDPDPESDPDPKPERRRRRWPWRIGGWVWLWAAVAGAVAASGVGYRLADWNGERGVYAVEVVPSFPRTDWTSPARPTLEEVAADLETLFVDRAPPEHLALLPHLRRLDEPASRAEVTAVLEALAAERVGEAARWLGLLALARGEPLSEFGPPLRRAAELGDAEAAFRLADRVLAAGSPSGGTASAGESWREVALRELEDAARVGHAEAQQLWAIRRCETEPQKAFRFMESAARDGDPAALYQLGLFLATGTGTEADPGVAVRRFRSAAERGEERAMFWLGRCLESGHGVRASFTEARRWMRMASARGQGGARRWCAARGLGGGRVAAK